MEHDPRSIEFQEKWPHILTMPEGSPYGEALHWTFAQTGEDETKFGALIGYAHASNGPPGLHWGRYIGFLDEDLATRFKLTWC